MRSTVDWLSYYPGYSLLCDDNTRKTHVDEIERFRINFQGACRLSIPESQDLAEHFRGTATSRKKGK